jgi:hypothetical protein
VVAGQAKSVFPGRLNPVAGLGCRSINERPTCMIHEGYSVDIVLIFIGRGPPPTPTLVSEQTIRRRHRPASMLRNNRAENSHLPIRRRERKQQKFKSQGSA